MRKTLLGGELTSVRVRLWLPKKQGGVIGEMDVHLQRHGDGRRCDAYYVREGMTITKLNARASQRGIEALVNVDSGPLAKLLGDTEGPAHEDWETSAERPNQEWKTWKGRVKFVRGIVDSLVEVLTPPTTRPDFDLLSDYFSMERVGGAAPQKHPGAGSNTPSGLAFPTPAPKWYSITERMGGFTLSRTAGIPRPADLSLRVSLAYDIPRGDPLQNWSPIDFKVGNKRGDLQPNGKGLRVSPREGNIFVLTVIEEDFNFSLSGFDPHRDLFVRVDELGDAGEVES